MKLETRKKQNILRCIISGGLLALCGIGLLLSRLFPGAVANIFAPFSQGVSGLLGKVFSIFPFSAVEFLLYAFVLALPLSIVVYLCTLFKAGRLRRLATLGSCWLLTASSLLTAFLFFWGYNYYAPSMTERMGIRTEAYTLDELTDAAVYYIGEMNRYAAQVPRAPDGTAELGSFQEMAVESAKAVEQLRDTYSCLNGMVSPAKPVTFSEWMNWTAYSGIYSPFTGECNVNAALPDIELPFTMAHELSHRLGTAKENEANYLAFLACSQGQTAGLRYSAYYYAFVYCYNAVARVDSQRQAELYQMISEPVLADIAAVHANRAKYAGKVNEVTDRMNDAYLKAMNEPAGVQSYGKVVDLLIAHYLDIAAEIS